MYRAVFTIVLFTFLAAGCYGQITSTGSPSSMSTDDGMPNYADMNCNADKVGYTYPLNTPLYYYTCHDENTPILLRCVDGTGYINNGYIEGCVPWSLWDCTSKADKPTCTTVTQDYPSPTPNIYWQCAGSPTPNVLTCPEGQAFVSSSAAPGCQVWSVWLQYCPY